MKIKIFGSKEEADKYVLDVLYDVIKTGGNVIGLPTGSTPLGLYKMMCEDYKKGRVSFKDIITINLDEYIGLDQKHPASYYKFMRESLFDFIDVDANNIYVPKGTGSIQNNILEYDKVLNENPIDLQLLGIGSNGHVAFNEPGCDVGLRTHEVVLSEQTISDNSRFFNSIDEVPKTAISMGIRSIMDSKKIVLIAYGKSKASAVLKLINNDISIPASYLRNHDDIIIVCDKEAGSLCTELPY